MSYSKNVEINEELYYMKRLLTGYATQSNHIRIIDMNGQKAEIWTGSLTTSGVEFQRGVRQGSVLSPPLVL